MPTPSANNNAQESTPCELTSLAALSPRENYLTRSIRPVQGLGFHWRAKRGWYSFLQYLTGFLAKPEYAGW